jgi:hypothetical protein
MKNICKLFICIFSISLLTTSCNKKEPALPAPSVIKLTLQGYSVGDTLEAVKGNEVIATLRANAGFSAISLVAINGDKEEIGLRKKGTTAILKTLEVTRSPFTQQKRIYFDGKTIDDKIDLTPVTNPENMGFRIQFKTDFPYFYGGPVDFIFFEQTYNMETWEISIKEIKSLKNIDPGTFSAFIELPDLHSTDMIMKSYAYKVFKAGTTELPYTAEANLSNIEDMENNYGMIENFKTGESRLLIVSPYYTGKDVSPGYQTEDIAYFFR